MAGRGPLPKDPSLRRHRGGDGLARRQVMLPAGGRVGDPPVWPLEGKREGELDVWRRLWATPQAAAWEGCGFDHELAMLARLVAAADQPYLNVRQMTALYAEIRQMEDRFGLNPPSLMRLGWTIEDPSKRTATEEHARALDLRSRMEVLG